MSSTSLKRQPEAVADKVLKRAELNKMARRLQNRLALAQFKTKHGVEDMTLDMLEPRFAGEQERRRRKRLSMSHGNYHNDGDIFSDSSSSASDGTQLPYPSASRALMSSPLKAGPLFSDAIGSSNGSTGHRKRTYMHSYAGQDAFQASSPSKRFRSSPTAHKSFGGHGGGGFATSSNSSAAWRDHHQLAQSSPIKPRRQHFTTMAGPDVSLFRGSQRISEAFEESSPNYAAMSDDDDDLLPAHSFVRPDTSGSGPGSSAANAASLALLRASPPRTPPPMRNRSLNRMGKDSNRTEVDDGKSAGGEDPGADLLLFLAASPSPANPRMSTPRISGNMEPPSTPPPRNFHGIHHGLPSSVMPSTPGGSGLGGNLFPATPSQNFDFSDFINITPSPAPAQKGSFKTPIAFGGRTPLSVAKTSRRLTYEDLNA